MTKVQVARATRLVALVAALVGFAGAAWAQRPSEEQIAAVRQACRSDFIAHCAGVPTGGAQALLCLREHLASLSPTCQEAVNAAGSAAPAAPAAEGPAPAAPPAAAPAPAAAPVASTPAPPPAAAALARMRPNQEQLGIIVQACGTDMSTHCANAARGPGWELKCLQDSAANLSVGCQQVLAAVASAAPAEPATTPAAPSSPPPAAAAAPTPPPAAAAAPPPAPAAAQRMRPTREQLGMIIQSCRGDIREHCAGAERGPGWRLKCLKENAASLSSGCQQALAAVASGAPAEPAARPAAPPSAAPPAAALPRMERPVSPRDVLFLLRTSCGADFRNYCRGVPFGGGRVIGCLRENAANLSPQCREAFMALVGGR
jgi:hypothetical protein